MTAASARSAAGFAIAALAIAALAIEASVATPYELRVLALAGCQVLLVLGYQLVFGHAGAFSLAQGAFFGLGAYVTAILGTRYGLGFIATFPCSILLPALLAAVVAIPVLRLASHYFALATLGLAQVLLLAFVSGGDWTGGALGIAGIPSPSFWSLSLGRGLPLAILIWVLVALGALLAARLTHGLSRLGFVMLRSELLAAAALGIDAARLRYTVFVLSAGYAGAAGALEAHTVGVVSAETLGFGVMVTCLAMTVIGGGTRIAGAFLGALLLTYLPEQLRFLAGQALLVYGAALIAVLILAPEGLAGLLSRASARWWPVRAAATSLPVPSTRSDRGGGSVPLLEARGLARRFGGIEALAGVDFAIAAGEILGLIGPNGSGKTTLANIVTGLVAADRGSISFLGRPIGGIASFEIARRGIARSFQAPALPAELTALEAVVVACASRSGVLGFGAALRGRDRGARRRTLEAEAMSWLHRLRAGDAAARRCGELPPALARSVEIARALALHPRLLILDEPAAGLAEREQLLLAATLRALAAENLGIIVIEHDMPFLLGLADRVLALDAGRVIAQGSPAQIRRDPAVIAAYLGSAAAA